MDKTVPAPAAKILDFVRRVETGRDDPESYDVIYGHNEKKLTRPVTTMTVDELQGWQAGFTKAFGSSASGAYQFMRETLKGLRRELGLRDQQVMTPDLQDRLAYHLLKRRGYEKFMAGTLPAQDFARNLAMEWASLPVLIPTRRKDGTVVQRGQSYYAGDKLNRALVEPEDVESLLQEVKAMGAEVTPVPDVPDEPERPVEPVPSNEEVTAMINLLLPALIQQLVPIIIKKVSEAAADPSIPISSPRPVEAGRDIARDVVSELNKIPEVQHATNQEPWYQSRVTLGAIAAIIAGILGLLGIAVEEEQIDTAVEGLITIGPSIGALLGGLYAWYGRWKASVPIGERATVTPASRQN